MRHGHTMLRSLALTLLAVLVAVPVFAAASKLDARARVALSQIRSGASLERMLEGAAAVGPTGELDVFITGPVSRAQLEAAGARVRTELPGIFTAWVPEGAIEAIEQLPGVTRIQGAAPVEYELDVSVPTTGANLLRGAGPGFAGLAGQGVLLGDVDSGIDYDHGDFDDAFGNTRLVNIWDQTVAGVNPAGFAYGNECTPAQINAGTCSQINTDGHGTHVMGIAGGDGSQSAGLGFAYQYAGMAPMADLIMVKTNLSTAGILDGVNYIFQKATLLGKNAVVNLSLGSHFGPHDGTSPFEAGLSAMTGPGRIIAKSAGNERGQARHAEVFAAGAGTNATMSIAGSAAGRVVAIDGYYEATENLSVRITTPGGTVIGPVALGSANAAFPGTLTTNGYVYVENGLAVTATGDPQVYIEINVPNPTGGATMNGTWTFTFIPVTLGAANGEVDLWRFFNSSGTTANFAVGNQPTEELVSEPGNAAELIVVASWTSKRFWEDCNGNTTINFNGSVNPGLLSPFSSPGPTRDGRQKPDIAAPGSAIASATTFDVAQACAAGGGASALLPDGLNHVMNQGTSMAAPHVAGAVALILQKYGAVTPAFVKNFLNTRAVVDANTGVVWNKDFGNGKLFLGDMVDPSVTVTNPNGGEVFFWGQNVNLTWNASDNVGVTTVDLAISRDNGGSWTTIATGEANDGSYTWNVTPPSSIQCLLRVTASDAMANAGSDVSDAIWAIQDGATPTLLQLLAAESREDGVQIRWQLSDPALAQTAALERSDAEAGVYARVAADKSVSAGIVTVLDRGVEAGRTYWYRIVAQQDGQAVTFGPIAATAAGGVKEFALSRPMPNPMLGSSRISFALPQGTNLKVAVHDVQGREIAVLASGAYPAGRHDLSWSGGTAAGRAPAGLYFVRMTVPGRAPITERLVIAR